MQKRIQKLIILLFLPFLLFSFISCDLFTNTSGDTNTEHTVDENDLEVILNTLSVFEQNYYAVFDFESDIDHYIVEKEDMYISSEHYKIMEKLPGYTIQYTTIYESTNQGAKIELKDWDVNDFILSPTFPHPISWLSYFLDKDVEIDGNLNRVDGDFGTTVSSDSDDDLEIKVNSTTYDIVFSYYYSSFTDIATASLSIDGMNYSTHLKEFLEANNAPDDD